MLDVGSAGGASGWFLRGGRLMNSVVVYGAPRINPSAFAVSRAAEEYLAGWPACESRQAFASCGAQLPVHAFDPAPATAGSHRLRESTIASGCAWHRSFRLQPDIDDAAHFFFARSTRTSRNSSGPLSRRRFRLAVSSTSAVCAGKLSMTLAARSFARSARAGAG
jgi:hypothetical protein